MLQQSRHLWLYLWKFHIPFTKDEFISKLYLAYFEVPLGDQDKTWAAHKVCALCVETLTKWSQVKPKYFKFGTPMIQREPKDHLKDCYFCKVNVKGFSWKNKQRIKYFNLDSALLPVAHCEEVRGSEITRLPNIHDEILSEVSTTDDEGETINMEFRPTDALLGKSILFNQVELNDLVRDLYFPKQYVELLVSRLNDKNQQSHGTSVTTVVGKLHFGSILSATTNLCITKISKDFLLSWALLT